MWQSNSHSVIVLCDYAARKLMIYLENWLFVCILLQQCNCTHFQQCVDGWYDFKALKILVQNAIYVTTLLSQSVYFRPLWQNSWWNTPQIHLLSMIQSQNMAKNFFTLHRSFMVQWYGTSLNDCNTTLIQNTWVVQLFILQECHIIQTSIMNSIFKKWTNKRYTTNEHSVGKKFFCKEEVS
jgi:hypothetical protein